MHKWLCCLAQDHLYTFPQNLYISMHNECEHPQAPNILHCPQLLKYSIGFQRSLSLPLSLSPFISFYIALTDDHKQQDVQLRNMKPKIDPFIRICFAFCIKCSTIWPIKTDSSIWFVFRDPRDLSKSKWWHLLFKKISIFVFIQLPWS